MARQLIQFRATFGAEVLGAYPRTRTGRRPMARHRLFSALLWPTPLPQPGMGRQEDLSPELNESRVQAALAGEPAAVRQLLDAVLPVIHTRVARALLRRSQSRGRDITSEVADLTQEVFVALFDDDAKALRAWSSQRGLSLANFVGLLAERRVASILRSRHRNPWTETPEGDGLDPGAAPAPQAPERHVASRHLLERLLEHLRASLSPRGLELFYRLYVEEQSVDEVCGQTGLSAAAVYQWRSRLRRAAQAAMDELKLGSEPWDVASAGKGQA